MQLNRSLKKIYDILKLRRLAKIPHLIVAFIRILTYFAIGYAIIGYAKEGVSPYSVSLTAFAMLGIAFIGSRAYALHQERKYRRQWLGSLNTVWRQTKG